MTKDQRHLHHSVLAPSGLIQECEPEVGIPVGDENVCFTSQAGGSWKIEIDLRYGEQVHVNSCTQNLWIEVYPAMPKDL